MKKAPESVTKEKTNATDSAKRNYEAPKGYRSGANAGRCDAKDCGSRGRSEGACGADCARHDSRRSHRQRQNAEQLLHFTDDQLKQLAGRTLDARQQETAGQIRNYMDGARSALKEGDLRRASTLAEKAHLLAEDLVKH